MIELHTRTAPGKQLDDKIIPMINVIFLLLLFFILAGSLTELEREGVHPPHSGSAVVSAGTEGDWLLTASGELIVGEQRLGRGQVAQWLHSHDAALPRYLRLRADARTPASELLPLMELLREQGVQRIALVTISDRSRE